MGYPNMKNKVVGKNVSIGSIVGGGIGSEVMDISLECLYQACSICNLRVNELSYKGLTVDTAEARNSLREFYAETRDIGGVILRTSLYAPIVYWLRREFELIYKMIYIKSSKELVADSPLKEDRVRFTDILLIRDNAAGAYHGETDEILKDSNRVASIKYSYVESQVRSVARSAFSFSAKRSQRLHLLIKCDVLGHLGQLWVDMFREMSAEYPDVTFDIFSPDVGSAELITNPSRFDVVVGLDTELDMLSDQMASIVHGSRGITPSINMSMNGFASYQTIHGTGDGLKGKDLANPVGMVLAGAQLLGESFGNSQAHDLIVNATFNIFNRGYRTGDMFKPGRNHQKVGTKEMGRLILSEITSNKIEQCA